MAAMNNYVLLSKKMQDNPLSKKMQNNLHLKWKAQMLQKYPQLINKTQSSTEEAWVQGARTALPKMKTLHIQLTINSKLLH